MLWTCSQELKGISFRRLAQPRWEESEHTRSQVKDRLSQDGATPIWAGLDLGSRLLHDRNAGYYPNPAQLTLDSIRLRSRPLLRIEILPYPSIVTSKYAWLPSAAAPDILDRCLDGCCCATSF
jgi:hypothetical protein